jgi:tetratricopeptide (TPR) repeat protein
MSWFAIDGTFAFDRDQLILLVIELAIAWILDRFTFHLLPDPIRGLLRWHRAGQLRRAIENNPRDLRARFELADILIQQRRFSAAVDVLRPNASAPEPGAPTLFLFAVACHGAGLHEEAERALLLAKSEDPDYKAGDIDLELGRVRLARGQFATADAALKEFLLRRRSSVEARVLLARVREKLGDADGAERLRHEAWKEYEASPSSTRRRERIWAWRAKPLRPVLYGFGLIALLIAIARLWPTL